MKILIATSNPGKIKEFREMLEDANHHFTSLSDHRKIESPDETGHTFRANACLKASFYATHFDTGALADDSG